MATVSLPLRVQPRDGQARTPWRNGGGETRELCAWPEGAGLDAFVWRVSVASVARDGPFSRYPGVTRTAVMVDGAGFRLTAGSARIELARAFAQATFDGAPAYECKLTEGPVQVFNVMVREPAVARVSKTIGALVTLRAASFRIVYAARGACEVRVDGEDRALDEGDAGWLVGGAAPLLVQPARPDACVLIASIDAAGAA